MSQSLSGPNWTPPFKLTFGAILTWASLGKTTLFILETHRKVFQFTMNRAAGWPLKKKVSVCECVYVLGEDSVLQMR